MTGGPLDREFEALREDYRATLLRDLEQLEAQLAGLRAGDGASDELAAARSFAHRLMGTSGSYGFDACSAALAQLESSLERFGSGAGFAAVTVRSEFAAALAAARAEAVGP